jgi:hypothetical protein
MAANEAELLLIRIRAASGRWVVSLPAAGGGGEFDDLRDALAFATILQRRDVIAQEVTHHHR